MGLAMKFYCALIEIVLMNFNYESYCRFFGDTK